MGKVLVTGGSGFIASRCILELLAAGHDVRCTVRSAAREAALRATLRRGGPADAEVRLDCVVTDLAGDAGWDRAVAACDHVLHVASPSSAEPPRNEAELLVPAVAGTLRVLRAARDAGVRRVVLTSSFAAIGHGAASAGYRFSETDWTDPHSPGVSAYVKSKTLAERAAWDFVATEGGGLQLCVINPVGVFGPVLGVSASPSIMMVRRLMDGTLAGCPRLEFGVVDVRDVADLQIRAMTDPAANGERFLAVSGGFMSMAAIAAVLRRRLGHAARHVPTATLPDWLVRLVAIGEPALRQLLPELGRTRTVDGGKAGRLLGWAPRSGEEALVATARSLAALRLLRPAGSAR